MWTTAEHFSLLHSNPITVTTESNESSFTLHEYIIEKHLPHTCDFITYGKDGYPYLSIWDADDYTFILFSEFAYTGDYSANEATVESTESERSPNTSEDKNDCKHGITNVEKSDTTVINAKRFVVWSGKS